MMNKRNTVDLPEDLVVDIFSRVPAIALTRLRSTSKAWNALVKDVRLSKKHTANAPKQSLIIMLIDFRVFLLSCDIRGMQDNKKDAPSGKIISQFSLKDPLTNYSEEVDICNVFHCDGLLLCTTEDNNRLVVWNPVSGETKWIQPINSYKESDIFALGYDSKSSCYKIIRMDQSAGGDRLQAYHEIYDFTSNSWTVVGATTDWFIPDSRIRGVYFKGNTYWLSYSQYGQYKTLLSFDFSTERFQTHSLPHYLLSDVTLSVVSEDQLCLLYDKTYMECKIESTGVIMLWRKRKILRTKVNYKFSHWMRYLANEQTKFLVCYDNTMVHNNILHIAAEDRYIQVDHHGRASSGSSIPFILSYVPTLVQIQQDI